MTSYSESSPVKSSSGAHCKGFNFHVSLMCLICIFKINNFITKHIFTSPKMGLHQCQQKIKLLMQVNFFISETFAHNTYGIQSYCLKLRLTLILIFVSCQRFIRLSLRMRMTVSVEGVFVDVGQTAVPGGSGCWVFCSASCCSSAFCLDSLLYVRFECLD